MSHRLILSSIVALALSAPLEGQTLNVRHDHDPWGSCEGNLEISENGIRFIPDEGDHLREWAWIDIQSVDRRSPFALSVLTYEDQAWRLGRDRAFDFTLLPGETELTEASFGLIRTRLAHPVTDRVAMTIEPAYQVQVKHLHAFGGCEGTLTFGRDYIVYATSDEHDARTWRRQDVRNVWSSGPFDLELGVLEGIPHTPGRTARFRFQLKEALDRAQYELLRREFLLAH